MLYQEHIENIASVRENCCHMMQRGRVSVDELLFALIPSHHRKTEMMDRQLQVAKRLHFNWKSWLQNGLLIIAVGFVFTLIASRWSELRSYHWQLNIGWLLLSMLIMVGAWLVEVGVWRALVQMLGGEHFPYSSALRIWFLTLLVRYVPGNVWQPVSVALHGQKRGLRPEAMLASVALYQVVSVLAAIPIAVIYLVQYKLTGAPWGDSTLLTWLILASLLIPLLLLLANPAWLTSLANWGLRLIKRPPLTMKLTRMGLLGCIAATVGSWLLWGGAFAALVPGVLAWDSLGIGDYPLLPGLIYAYPLAHAVGMASLLTPTGIGVREGVFTWLATPILGSSAALVAVLAMRLWTTLAEMLMASFVYVGMRDE